MFSQMAGTQSLSKASSILLRMSTDAHYYDFPEDVNVIPLLDSKFDSEKSEGLKRLLAFIAQGYDVCNFFPQVVKNVASPSLEVKKLAYLYLLHYAEKRPNEALLSINCFQKDLGDTNPLVRAWALRAMAGIRLHVVAPLVLAAVGKCARDPSVYVRKCAANALPKLHDLRMEENATTVEEIVGILLNDNSPGVVGAAAASFACVCPNNFHLIAKNYKRLCQTLPDVEEWGQIILIGILLRYSIAKHGLVKESIMSSSCSEKHDLETDSPDCLDAPEEKGSEIVGFVSRSYLEGPDKYLSNSISEEDPSQLNFSHFTSARSNEDVKILLQCTSPLLWSRNSAVVLAAAAVHWIMAPIEDIKKIVKPLLFILRSSIASRYVVLCNIQVFAKAIPSLFAPHYEDFYISSSDTYQVKALKLEILSSIATDSSIPLIFQELQDYVRDTDRRFAADTVAAIGLCAQRLPKLANTCLEGLLALTTPEISNGEVGYLDGEAVVLIQALISIRAIIKLDPHTHEKVIVHLARSLDSVKVPEARSMIIWMVGEYNSIGQIIPKILLIFLKYLAHCFTTEAHETKLQILNAAVKVTLCAKGEDLQIFKRLLCYLLELSKFDSNYDVRDRARILQKLLSFHIDSHDPKEKENEEALQKKDRSRILADHIFGEKTIKTETEPVNYRFFLPGSLSQIVLHAAPGYDPLPAPCSLVCDENGLSLNPVEGLTQSDSYDDNDDDSVSGSLNEEIDFSDGSQDSITDSSGTEDKQDSGSFINLTANPENDSNNNFEELMSKKALESWLDENPGPSKSTSNSGYVQRSSARISIGDIRERVKPKSYTLLDPTNGNGLSVDYTFSSEISIISPLLVCLEVTFANYSSEPMTMLSLSNEDSQSNPGSSDQTLAQTESSANSDDDIPTLISMEEITNLDPGEITKRTLQVQFRHHLVPLKLVLWCSRKKYPVRMRPDIGYFLKPLQMNIQEFSAKESQLPGMFEYTRRCIFTDHIKELSNENGDSTKLKDTFILICESIGLKMLSNTNLFLVTVELPVAAKIDDASGLCLRFSGEILSNSFPCLITVTVDGKCSEPLNLNVKVNCEETVFGLNLLNRVAYFLAEDM
jgi:AP-3 complex subunit beta